MQTGEQITGTECGRLTHITGKSNRMNLHVQTNNIHLSYGKYPHSLSNVTS